MAAEPGSVLDTCDRMVRLKVPNLLRLYLNPFVAQTCLALSEIVHALWPDSLPAGDYPSFLANSGDEGLSGAIKLARYTQNSLALRSPAPADAHHHSTRVLLVDDGPWFRNFAEMCLDQAAGAPSNDSDAKPAPTTKVFIPDVTSITIADFLRLCESEDGLSGILVLSPRATWLQTSDSEVSAVLRSSIRRFLSQGTNLWICCVDQEHFLPDTGSSAAGLVPDIVVFDETFTGRQVPFGAFSSRPTLSAQWRGRGMTTFHSTTYQPNSISTMHFLKCLAEHSPQFFRELEPRFRALSADRGLLRRTFRTLFSPALARLTAAAGFDSDDVTASGHYLRVGSKKCFDGVGGVACSLRGHNPDTWVSEIQALESNPDIRGEVADRLFQLTGLRHHVPAVSGSSAAEHALKLGLLARVPHGLIVALQGGFSGKTLLALAGTSRDSYRRRLDPLYPDVVYVDPFAADAVSQLSRILRELPVALIQLELIQGVGGVREIPAAVLDLLRSTRQDTGVLLFVDEVQTGMFRTGPFVRSTELSLAPDLLTIGKGTSDMMIPFALTLYSDRVDHLLQSRAASYPAFLQQRCGYELGYRSVLNTLRRHERENSCDQVLTASQILSSRLQQVLADVDIVKDIRCYGLLIGIELDLQRTVAQRCGLNPAQLYLLQMTQHRNWPLLMGFCQYEPHVLKLTPPLTITEDEVELLTRTISDTLRASPPRLLLTGLQAWLRSRA